MKYFRILADPRSSARRFLGEPASATGDLIDAREFTQGMPYTGPDPAIVPLEREGNRVAFNFAAFDMPVLSEKLAAELTTIASDEVVFYPVLIDSTTPGFSIMNSISSVECLDETNSKIVWWRPEDGRPDRVGDYRMVTDITISPALAKGRHVFRIKGWEVALIVSETIRDRLIGVDRLGAIFSPVCK